MRVEELGESEEVIDLDYKIEAMVGLENLEGQFFETGPSFFESGSNLFIDPDGPSEMDDMVADEALIEIFLHECLEVEDLRGVSEEGEKKVFDLALAVRRQAPYGEGLPHDGLTVETVCLLLLVV